MSILYNSDGLPIIRDVTIDTFVRDINQMSNECGAWNYLVKIVENMHETDGIFMDWLGEGARLAEKEGGEMGYKGFFTGAVHTYEIFRRQEEVNHLEGSDRQRIIPCRMRLPGFFEDIMEEALHDVGEGEKLGFFDAIALSGNIIKNPNQNRKYAKWVASMLEDPRLAQIAMDDFIGSTYTYEFLRRQIAK